MRQILLFLFLTSLIEAKILIVTNKFSLFESLPKTTIQYLYLGKIDFVNGVKITPLLSDKNELHKEFLSKIINKSYNQYNSYWSRLIFTGRRAFPLAYTKYTLDIELKKMNTITYIDEKDMNPKWKIIYEEE